MKIDTKSSIYCRGKPRRRKKYINLSIIIYIYLNNFNIYLLQNHTRTTSFSIARLSASIVISSDVGFGFWIKAFSRATLTLVSIDVLFFRRLPIASGVVSGFDKELGLFNVLSASSSHFCNSGFSLHMFLKERFNASNLE